MVKPVRRLSKTDRGCVRIFAITYYTGGIYI
jgi:hypothetical protein